MHDSVEGCPIKDVVWQGVANERFKEELVNPSVQITFAELRHPKLKQYVMIRPCRTAADFTAVADDRNRQQLLISDRDKFLAG
jgi:hypothetical protein